MADLKRGRIVWAELLDPQGRNPKVRPAVVLTATAEIKPDGEIQVAAITGATDLAPAEDRVELPWLASGHPKTGLSKPSVVVVTWLATVEGGAVQREKGLVPPVQMLDILKRIADRTATPPPEPPFPPPGYRHQRSVAPHQYMT